MAKKASGAKTSAAGRAGNPLPAASQSDHGAHGVTRPTTKLKSSSLLDTRVVYCGDNLEQLAKLPNACVDLIYIEPPFNSNRNYGQRPDRHNLRTRPRRSALLKTTTRTPRLTLTTCARAACNSPASSNRPAAFITTATGTPATTSRSCSTRFSEIVNAIAPE